MKMNYELEKTYLDNFIKTIPNSYHTVLHSIDVSVEMYNYLQYLKVNATGDTILESISSNYQGVKLNPNSKLKTFQAVMYQEGFNGENELLIPNDIDLRDFAEPTNT